MPGRKKKESGDRYRKHAELSEFYGFPTFGLNIEQLLGLEANIPVIKARRMLEAAQKGEIELTHNGWYDVTMLVTGDRDQAEKAASDYVKRCYAENRTPQ